MTHRRTDSMEALLINTPRQAPPVQEGFDL